jgi:hypothetical protein
MTNGLAVRVKERIDSASSYVERRKMRHKVVSQHETNENVIEHSAFFTLKFNFGTDLILLLVHAVHVFYNRLRKFGDVNVVIGGLVQRIVDRLYKFRRLPVQEYAFGNVQVVQTQHD